MENLEKVANLTVAFKALKYMEFGRSGYLKNMRNYVHARDLCRSLSKVSKMLLFSYHIISMLLHNLSMEFGICVW